MRKKILLSCICVLLLTSCKSAITKLSNSSEPVVTIDNTNITNGEVYSTLKQAMGAYTLTNAVKSYISSKEIEVTDDMYAQAETSLAEYKKLYGDTFDEYLKAQNITEDEYVNKVILNSIRNSKLNEKYVDENYESLCTKYIPKKFNYIVCNNEEDAKSIKVLLTESEENASEVAESYNTKLVKNNIICTKIDTTFNSQFLSDLEKAGNDKWLISQGTDENYYVYKCVKVTDDDKENIKNILKSSSDVINDCETYYFNKYDLNIYDIDIAEQLQKNYSNLKIN